MYKRSEQTREALVSAAAELIATGRFADAGLVNICRVAGVSRGALYHHFASIAELVAEVYAQARERATVLVEDSFAGPAADGPARFSVALGAAMAKDQLICAGMGLGADGTDSAPLLRDEVLGMVRDRMVADARGGAAPDALADLAVVVTAGLESLGYTDSGWWDPRQTERLWGILRPLFAGAEEAAGTQA
ncbi:MULTISPECIES: TetR/AcrR family transcriptional regulator [unclassified Streptomyces]|uniref:TetR/AcrR family transcriptional regulator n=1 Tax=unclassified Streptomyces TaxID=2593676 RepID=UPI000CDA808D|nr:TetR/AcrR family transcriptional regulator [Streptomyces sp. SM10]